MKGRSNLNSPSDGDDRYRTAYRYRKMRRLLRRGYFVDPCSSGLWLRVVALGHEVPLTNLVATLKTFPKPSKYGIGGGRISKLSIDTLEELGEGRFRAGRTLFRFDRGGDVDRLAEYPDAKRFYDALIEELN